MADMSLRGFVYRNGGFYMSENILRIQNVEKYYGSRNNLTKAIDDISFDVNKGEFVAIMGASGSGKTTLLNCISTIDKVTSGNIYVDGNNIHSLKEVLLTDSEEISWDLYFRILIFWTHLQHMRILHLHCQSEMILLR